MSNLLLSSAFLAALLLGYATSQNATTTTTTTGTFSDAQICQAYKKEVFEQVQTFGFLMENAPVRKVTVDNCRTYTPLIVGGRPAEPKEFPHIARLGYRSANNSEQKTSWFCGGTLISDRFVLTAAHCFYADNELNVVRLGELDFGTEDDDAAPKDYAIRKYTEHEAYSYPLNYNDIGLIELAESVKFDRYKHPACLPFDSGWSLSSFVAVGWGATKFAGTGSDKLLKVKLKRFGRNYCDKFIEGEDFPNGFNDTTQLCVGSERARDTCNGDSGGPLLAYHKVYPCMYHVIGVTSAGIGGCGTPKVPGVYTKVFHYLPWIKAHMNGV